ncbi:hypothetical protein M0R45_018632 [Rubus argutus]|uniref:Uncharacterized protein n=1 Tax=Rubus argutus TaxID=59490 RepID=A0AAW1X316_RUBAR
MGRLEVPEKLMKVVMLFELFSSTETGLYRSAMTFLLGCSKMFTVVTAGNKSLCDFVKAEVVTTVCGVSPE